MLKSLWRAGAAKNAIFLADYAINPLGVKSDAAIADVVESWLAQAAAVSDTLVIACNTLSIRYRQLFGSATAPEGLSRIISMADCFEAMVRAEAEQLAGKNVLIIGTEFTASQVLYAEIVESACTDASVHTVAATDLERKIARFETWDGAADSSLTAELGQAIERTDVAVLACTCFPMISDDLEALFPGVLFLDPGAYCAGLVPAHDETNNKTLSISVTGEEISRARVTEFAESYLGVKTCCT